MMTGEKSLNRDCGGWLNVMRPGLTARLLIMGMVAILCVMGIGGWILHSRVNAVVMRGYEMRLNEHAQRILSDIDVDHTGVLFAGNPRYRDEFGQIFSGWYWQLRSGNKLIRSRSLWDEPALRVNDPQAGQILLSAQGPRNEMLLGVRQTTEVQGVPVVLEVFGPADSLLGELRRLDQVMVVMLLVLMCALAVTILIQVRFGLNPLRQLTRTVARVREGIADQVGLGYGPDLDPLAAELDKMLARNARVVARGRSHAADLSHALKKPLALLSAEASKTAPLDYRFVLEQVYTMSGLIDRHLSRGGSTSSGADNVTAAKWIDITDIARNMLALMQHLHQEKCLEWRAFFSDAVFWRGEQADLEEILGNLLDNAGKWAKTQVSMSLGLQEGHVFIRIEDDGRGLTDAQITQAIHRGRRFDEKVEGSGLGLAITEDIAITYGGRLQLTRSGLGGLCVMVALPSV